MQIGALVIYVAGPYTGQNEVEVAENVKRAELVGQEIMRRGHAVICPHSMTHDWDIGTGISYQQFLDADLEILRRCDAICMVLGWQNSKGSRGEYELAQELGLQIFELLHQVPDLRQSGPVAMEAVTDERIDELDQWLEPYDSDEYVGSFDLLTDREDCRDIRSCLRELRELREQAGPVASPTVG